MVDRGKLNLNTFLEGEYLPRKSKVVCTMGPSIWDQLDAAIASGMDVARFNFSHGDHKSHKATLDKLLALRKSSGSNNVAILLDTKGPEIRTGFLKDGKDIEFKRGDEMEIVTDYSVLGDRSRIACSYKKLPQSVKVNSVILCADGSISMTVKEVLETSVVVTLMNDGILGERKNMNLPGIKVDLPTITEKDKVDLLEFGVKNKVDFIALSFVQSAEDIDIARTILGAAGANIKLIAKIENEEGLANFDGIVKKADGIMVARGDLGMEIPTQKVFIAQKLMIQKCNELGKMCVVATQMLESMKDNPRPTRAEATDVANAVLDGADAVMLSGETAGGKYPLEAIRTMAEICKEAEMSVNLAEQSQTIANATRLVSQQEPKLISPMESIMASAVTTSFDTNAKLIIVLSETGTSPRLLAKYRPEAPILLLTTNSTVARQARLLRGVSSLVYQKVGKSSDDQLMNALEKGATFAHEAGLVAPLDIVIALHSWKFQMFKTTKDESSRLKVMDSW